MQLWRKDMILYCGKKSCGSLRRFCFPGWEPQRRMEYSGIYLQLGHMMNSRCGNPWVKTLAAIQGEAQPHCPHYKQQTVAMMKRDDSFYVRLSLMSNGPIITADCKQEKTLHTDMGLVLEWVFVVVWKTAGSCVCCMCVCEKCVPSPVAAPLPLLLKACVVVSSRVESKGAWAHARRCSCMPCTNLQRSYYRPCHLSQTCLLSSFNHHKTHLDWREKTLQVFKCQ